jgi:hypothetical protein
MLRAALMAVARDPGLIEEAKRRRFDIDPVDGGSVQRMVQEIYDAPKSIKDEAKRLLAAK